MVSKPLNNPVLGRRPPKIPPGGGPGPVIPPTVNNPVLGRRPPRSRPGAARARRTRG